MHFQHLIPGQTLTGQGPGSPFFRRLVLAGFSPVLAVFLGLLTYGQWRGGQVVGLAGELRLLLTRVEKRSEGPPPVAGLAGFNQFVKAAATGEIRLSAEDFPDQVHPLKAAGAETIILGIDLERGPELIKTLNTPVPKLEPPVRIISTENNN